MPPWQYRVHPQTSNAPAARPFTGQTDTNRPLPQISPTAIDLSVPTLHPRRRGDSDAASAKHGRSFSHPFPSFFGGGTRRAEKRNPLKNTINVDSTDEDDSTGDGRPQQSSNTPSRKPSINAGGEPMIGRCMACDSTVRWPRDLKVFRCTICLTVNDLEPYLDTNQQRPGPNQNNRHPQFAVPRKPVPLTLERTRAIVDHCLHGYLRARHEEAAINPTRDGASSTPTTVLEANGQCHDPEIRSSLGTRSLSDPKLSPPITTPDAAKTLNQDRQGSLEFPRLPGGQLEPPHRSNPSEDPPDVSDYDGPSKSRIWRDTIFRPVENYIGSCLAGCDTLNRSFLTLRPEFQRAASEGQSTRTVPNKSHLASLGKDNTFSEIEVDAKTLLLGDIAENGSWWTGERLSRGHTTHAHGRERSPDSRRGPVNLKNPRINWTDVASWYRTLLSAGESWRDQWSALQAEPSSNSSHTKSITRANFELSAEIENDLLHSRNHLQRVLLKATENLLKRPRRPLKSPEDCRFFFIILANPLLLSPESALLVRRPNVQSARRAGPGQHSGITKRVLGLMAHLPNEVHQFLVSWFSRLSETHFQHLVDLVGGFVTYRLSRPSPKRELVNPTEGLVPSFSDSGAHHASQFHAALGGSRSTSSKRANSSAKSPLTNYGDDWQLRAAARVMALLFAANGGHPWKKREAMPAEPRSHSVGLTARHHAHAHGQLIPISSFYNTMLDYADLIADFEIWESNRGKFSFCQYPFFLSIYAKIRLMEMEARRQMVIKAREAFFDSILSNKAVSQYLVLKVRRDCLVEDSRFNDFNDRLRRISEAVGSGQGDIKKGLKIDFVGEEGVDAGGLRKEWFLLLIREVFDEAHGLFTYDEDSRFCYFNPHCFESSEQYFLVGVVTGLAIYNSTILDIAFPPFVFKKLLASTPITTNVATSTPRLTHGSSLEDLAELHPALARGLRKLLEYEGEVQETFCRDFVIEEDRYGEKVQVPLCAGGEKKPVTNANRRDFVECYLLYLLDTSVSRQYEPFKRGFFTVCGGNALSLFRPEEIELLIRGSDEPLDISSLRGVAAYEGWPSGKPPDQQPQVQWFWDAFESAKAVDQRKLLTFVTGSDRIPAMGATNLVIKIQLLDSAKRNGVLDTERFPTARTCFNTLVLHPYRSREQLEKKLWMAVSESEGFGLR